MRAVYIMLIGILLGRLLRRYRRLLNWIESILAPLTLIMLLLMGLQTGYRDGILEHFPIIGSQVLIITSFSVLGSLFLAYLYVYFRKR